jgi:hypothetical protein
MTGYADGWHVSARSGHERRLQKVSTMIYGTMVGNSLERVFGYHHFPYYQSLFRRLREWEYLPFLHYVL